MLKKIAKTKENKMSRRPKLWKMKSNKEKASLLLNATQPIRTAALGSLTAAAAIL